MKKSLTNYVNILLYFILLHLNVECINTKINSNNVCKNNKENIGMIFENDNLISKKNNLNYSELLVKYKVISKDNNAYLLLFKLLNNDKDKLFILLNNKDNLNDNYGLLINKYSLKTWSNKDIIYLKELIDNKNNRYLRVKNDKNNNHINDNIKDNILRIDYVNKLLLKGRDKEIKLLPNINNGKELSNEITLYKDKSLIKINDKISGINIKQLLSLSEIRYDNKSHSSFMNNNIKGVIRYYKFNKGSFGEVWRGLGFTEYLNEPYGDCNSKKKFTVNNFIWRRGELINHELNSLIIDILNMIKIDDVYYYSVNNNEKKDDNDENDNNKNVLDIVMKRMNNELDDIQILYNIVREVFFGILLYCLPHISRFLHLFEEINDDLKNENNSNLNNKEFEKENINKSNIWLVYRYEGISLNNLIFEIDNNGSVIPSEFWWKYIKNDKLIEKDILKDILYQIFIGLSKAHELGIIHRDIKPSNIFVSNNNNSFYIRIGDWGSAMIIDNNNTIFNNINIDELNQGLYGDIGATSNDETEGFQPPEVQFKSFSSNLNKNNRMLSYDIWSVGVIMLQIVWGNLEIFSVLNEDSEFQHIIKKIIFHFKNNLSQINYLKYDIDELINDSIYRLSLMRLCLLELSESKEVNEYGKFITKIIKKSIKQSTKNISHQIIGITKPCDDIYFSELLKKNDISGIGLKNKNAIQLIKQLLKPRYNERINITQILKHPYFT